MSTAGRILVVDEDVKLRSQVASALETDGHRVEQVSSGKQALGLLERRGYHLVLIELDLPEISGLQLIDYMREQTPSTPVIAMTAQGSVKDAVRAMQRGASDFMEKPLSLDQLKFAVKRALEKAALDHACNYLRHEQPYIYNLDDIVAESPAMKKVFQQVVKVASTDATVLLTGETGTGKSLIGGAIHFNSLRRAGTLITVNCAALSENLLESELFGHEKGAFTGAHKSRAGRFQQAHGGSLFLDEVGDMSPGLQAKVLRAIEEKIIERVGGSRSIEVDVRILAATNQDLEKAVRRGAFREDLYYRLNVAALKIPPLRERGKDILPLSEMFIRRICVEAKKRPRVLSPAAKETLLAHSWPGNIREMRNAIERAVIFATGDELAPQDLGLGESRRVETPSFFQDNLNLEALERRAIHTALERSGWVQRKAAELLGISPRALSYKLDKLGFDHPELNSRRRRR